jgi:hypothetical protein
MQYNYAHEYLHCSQLLQTPEAQDRQPSVVRTALQSLAVIRQPRGAISPSTAQVLSDQRLWATGGGTWPLLNTCSQEEQNGRPVQQAYTPNRHRQDDVSGLRSAQAEGAPERLCERMDCRASPTHVGDARTPVAHRGRGPSQERGSRRQPTGEPGALDNEAAARPADRGYGRVGSGDHRAVRVHIGGRS